MRKRDLLEQIREIYNRNFDGEVILTDLTNLFKIPIDKSRLTDYQIVNVDFEKLSLEVIDTKTETTFISSYSPYSEVLGFASPDNENLLNYIDIISINPLYKRKSIYNVGEEIPILERMTIRNNEYGLRLEKTMPNVIRVYSRQDGTRFLVEYFKEYENKKEKGLLTSLYKTNYIEKNIDSFERLYVNNNILNWDKNRPDHFFFDIEGNIINGTNLESKDYYIKGACFEKIDKMSITESLMHSHGNQIKDFYSVLDTPDVRSAILYSAYNYLGKLDINFHDLEILKINDIIQVKYSIKDPHHHNTRPIVLDTTFTISSSSSGNITISEIDSIIEALQKRFDDDKFIQFVLSELETFKGKLEIKNGLIQEELGELSPKLLMNKTFDEICDLISSNKDDYFSLISEQYDKEINGATPGEKGQSKPLKPKKN